MTSSQQCSTTRLDHVIMFMLVNNGVVTSSNFLIYPLTLAPKHSILSV